MSTTTADDRRRSPWAALRLVLRIGAPPRSRLALSVALGSAAAMCTVGLMACSGELIDRAALRPPLYTLTLLMAAVQLLALGRGPLRYGERLFGHDAALATLGRIRLWLYDRIEPQSPAGLSHWRAGDLLVRATADVDVLQDLYLRGIAPLVVAGITSVFAVTLVSLILPGAGAVLAACLVGAIGLTASLTWVRQRGLGEREAALHGELGGDVVELLRGAPDLVAFGRADEYLQRAFDADQALMRLARRRAWTAGAATALVIALTGVAAVGVMVVAVPAIGTHRLPGYLLAVLPLVVLGVFEVVTPVSDAVTSLCRQVHAAHRLLAIADLPDPVLDPADPARRPAAAGIEVDGASLRYEPEAPRALNGFTMSVPEGRRVALTGPSGAGKSSVVNLLLRFWPLEEGTATVGETPIDRLDQDSVRRMIGWVAQDSHLFTTTIRANIALARPGAGDEQIMDAARAAQLGPWIASLPDGLDTRVGELGALVSGGQRQRLALARALLAGPPVLVLDEPTSGLDRPTARRLLVDVLAANGGRSLVYVTHRHEELDAFDDVLMIDAGRVTGVRHRPSGTLGVGVLSVPAGRTVDHIG